MAIFRWVILKQLVRLKLEILLKMTHHTVESKGVKFHLLFPPSHLWQNGIKFMKGLIKPICYKLSQRLTHRHKVAVILSCIWIHFIYGGKVHVVVVVFFHCQKYMIGFLLKMFINLLCNTINFMWIFIRFYINGSCWVIVLPLCSFLH